MSYSIRSANLTRQRAACSGSGILLLMLLAATNCAGAARVIVYPYPWTSCAYGLVALSGELATRGHQVLLVEPAELSATIDGMLARERADAGRKLSIARLSYQSTSMETMRSFEDANLLMLAKRVQECLFESCAAVFGNQTTVDALFDFNADIMVGDAMMHSSWIMSDILRVPRVDYNPGAGGVTAEAVMYRLSIPSLAYTPVHSTALPPTGMNLPQRAVNAATMLAIRVLTLLVFPACTSADMRRHVNTTWRYELPAPRGNRPLLTLSGIDVGVELPRPLATHVKYVGPLLVAAPRPLPPDLEEFVAGAGDAGVVFAAFGTMSTVEPSALAALVQAFAALPQRVVWKIRDSILSVEARDALHAAIAAAGNIRALQWVPQQDLLGHPAVKLFVSHGGVHSMYEALWLGTPIVFIPLGMDQLDNARLAAEHHRAGRIVDRATLARGDTSQLAAALQQVAKQPEYQQRAAALSVRLRAQPGTPRSRAVDWIEYALATGPEPFLWSRELDTPWWQLQLLDVAAVAASVLGGFIAAVVLSLRYCLRRGRAQRISSRFRVKSE